ncbi:hypothetical protein HNQ02_003755 [Flavobacterium sp. 7E]|uniref:hypothetical protein n=1 Tax=Flavobacterium sp. 7E TaxID=2735898 RepID=UPI001570D3DE|nr:hypothetical protein [Flavobacterium sp. 7E]NRS90808.1 hypothetical protein [Flavobacterium sp. 7E]
MKKNYLISTLFLLVFISCQNFEKKVEIKKAENVSNDTKIGEINYERIDPKNADFRLLNDKLDKLLVNKGQTKLILKYNKSTENIVYFIFKEKVVSQNVYEKDTISTKNLYAYIYEKNKNELKQKIKFQDFGNELYSPIFFYDYCIIDDANKDGIIEFYLSYYGESDGLDAKPLKVIIYTQDNLISEFKKSKTTAFYPAGNENDSYYLDYDSNWKNLPESIKTKSKAILNEIKNKKIIDNK